MLEVILEVFKDLRGNKDIMKIWGVNLIIQKFLRIHMRKTLVCVINLKVIIG